MNQEKNSKNSKLIKTFSIFFILYALYRIIVLIYVLMNYDMAITHNESIGLNTKDTSYIILEASIIITYFLVGGIGIYLFKKWALYFIGIFGIYFFFMGLMDFIITVYAEYINAQLVSSTLLKIIWGSGSIYAFRNKTLFR